MPNERKLIMLPRGWREVSVQEICESVGVGIVIKPSQYYVPEGKGVRAFRSANVSEGRIEDSNWVYISHEGNRLNKKSSLKAGDVLVVRTGYPGTACVVTPEYEGTNAIDIVIARPNLKKVDPFYLCAYTNSHIVKNQVLSNQRGIAQKHLNVGAYQKIRIVLPSLEEQTKISKTLSVWDRVIEKKEQLIAAKEKRLYGLLDVLVRKESQNGQWRAIRLGEVFSERVETQCDHLKLLSITREQGVILREDVGRKDTSNEDKSKYLRICPGDIGYNTMRMWQGVSALSSLEGIISPAYTVCIPSAEIHGEFMAYYFKTPHMVHQFYRYSQGLTSDTWNLKFKHFAEIKAAIPPLARQKEIVGILNVVKAEISLIKKQAEVYRKQKRGLMQKLLTGKWRIKPGKGEAV